MKRALVWLEARGVERADLAIVLALAALSQIDWWTDGAIQGPRPLVALTALALALLFAFRRRAPIAVLALVVGYLILASLAWGAPKPIAIPLDLAAFPLAITLLASFAVGAYSDVARPLIRAGIVLALVAPLAVAEAASLLELVVLELAVFGAWAAGWFVRAQRLQAGRLTRRAAALVREQEEKARAAAAEERARIARELHDIVAHSLNVIVVQAAAERRVRSPERDSTHETLETIEQTGRQALVELRRLLGVMRRPGEELELRPQPSIRNLDDLADQVREAGLPVELRIDCDPAALPPGIDLSAYRIVQEALTNALKHAGPTSARVTILHRDSDLELEIADDGHGDGDGSAGHGLIGMRERAELFGGAIDAGPRPEGGYAVRARLPLQGERA